MVRQAPVDATIDPATGIYQITDRATGWSFLGQAGGQITEVAEGEGHDGIGGFHEISFAQNGMAVPMRASIRTYTDVRAVKFRLEYRKSLPGSGVAFPDFSAFPPHLHPFSYRDETFAPPVFGLAETATPWLLFDDLGRSAVISPASQFMVSRMVGDGVKSIGEGFDRRLAKIPAGGAQEAVIVFADRISDAWRTWGGAMRRLYARPENKPAEDPMVQRFGYWTDNGADYYYNYDLDKGYAGTLLAVRDRYREEGIPLGYLQLDSWWYSKSTDDPAGRPGGATKNPKLPAGDWNRYGGLMEYRANRDLFPAGLEAFQRRLGLPLVVHNRWVDRNSPYHRDFRISGVAVTDPKWWRATADYLATAHIEDYEQDWLQPIYAESPDLASEFGTADAFTDGMALAMGRRGLRLQYCMATPRFFLQGLRYPDLTTIRTSGDRFEPGKWAHFLLGSQLADAVGARPWCDVFKSRETGNMILAVLSAGPVGTGDALGKESKEGILRAVRADGTIVRPDAPLLPCDQTYMAGATGSAAPFWASTSTHHGDPRTFYFFGFRQHGDSAPWTLRLRDQGVRGEVYIYDPLTGTGHRGHADDPLEVTPDGRQGAMDYAYLMVAPVPRSGLAVLGDLSKWVPTGAQRLDLVEARRDGAYFRVIFAPGESSIRIEGISPVRPTVRASGGGQAALQNYDPATQRWSVDVTTAAGTRERVVECVVRGR